jgi:hypothetical protein
LTNFANFWGEIHQIVDIKKLEKEKGKKQSLVVNFIFWELHRTFPILKFKILFQVSGFPSRNLYEFYFFLTNTIIGNFSFSSRSNSTTFSNFLENFANFSILQNWGNVFSFSSRLNSNIFSNFLEIFANFSMYCKIGGKKTLVVSSFFGEHDYATYAILTIKKTLLLM